MSATRYTWSDMKRISADPGAKERIDDAKATEFKAVAAELEKRDPAGYEVFTGRGERTAPALLGVLVVLCMGLFIGLAMLMVLISRVMMQGLALAAPLAAVLGVLPTHTSVLARLWDLFTAALVAVAKFVVAGGVMALVLGAIQANPELGAGAKLFWVVVATVVALVLTRPIRSFKTIVPGLDPNRSYVRAAMSGVASYFGARVGSEEGTENGIRSSFPPTAGAADAVTPAGTASSTDARESLESLPAPVWASSTATGPVWTQVPVTSTPTAGAGGPAAGIAPAARAGQESRDWSRGQVWPGVVAGAPARRELAAAPLRLEAVPAEPDAARTPAVQDRPVANAGNDTVVDSPLVGTPGSDTEGSTPAATPTWAQRPRPGTPAVGGTEVVYPTGVIVAAEETPLYQRSSTDTAEATEHYVTLPEPELDQDGNEYGMVTYQSAAGASRG